jgi:type I restriction enzyme M protein
LKEIEAHGWSLNPGRRVSVAEREADDFGFYKKLDELDEELEWAGHLNPTMVA